MSNDCTCGFVEGDGNAAPVTDARCPQHGDQRTPSEKLYDWRDVPDECVLALDKVVSDWIDHDEIHRAVAEAFDVGRRMGQPKSCANCDATRKTLLALDDRVMQAESPGDLYDDVRDTIAGLVLKEPAANSLLRRLSPAVDENPPIRLDEHGNPLTHADAYRAGVEAGRSGGWSIEAAQAAAAIGDAKAKEWLAYQASRTPIDEARALLHRIDSALDEAE